MLRFINYLTLVVFACSAQIAFAANHYQKPGASVSLASHNYKVSNDDSTQTVTLKLNTSTKGSMQLAFSGSNGLKIVETPITTVDTQTAQQQFDVPVTIKTQANSSSYLNIFVSLVDVNGSVTNRAISATIIAGVAPQLKANTNPPSVISMPAIETINGGE